MDVTKPYKYIKIWGHGCHHTVQIYTVWGHGSNLYGCGPWVSLNPINLYALVDVPQPRKLICFGTMDVTKPYKFIWFGAMDVTFHPMRTPKLILIPGGWPGRRAGNRRFWGSRRPSPTAKPTGKGGGLCPPHFPMGLVEAARRQSGRIATKWS